MIAISTTSEGLMIHGAYSFCLLINYFFPKVLMLYDRVFKEKEHEASYKCQAGHYQYIVSLIKVSKDECSYEISKNLRSHVESPEEGEVESFVGLDSTVRNVRA